MKMYENKTSRGLNMNPQLFLQVAAADQPRGMMGTLLSFMRI